MLVWEELREMVIGLALICPPRNSFQNAKFGGSLSP